MSDAATIRELHDRASAAGESFYEDPESGLFVFTEFELLRRGRCCGTGCRHCPYAHEAVATEHRAERTQQPAWLTDRAPDPDAAVDVLFWSGGKDSFLTFRALRREARSEVVLLTTFDAMTRRVAHQEVPLDQIVRQAEALDVSLLGVPLFTDYPYEERMTAALDLVPNASRLVFGDLHLEHIRSWRMERLGPLAEARGLEMHFPVWKVAYEELFDDLEESGVPCEVTAVAPAWQDAIEVGASFDRALAATFPEGVDAFGERGEFHTLAKVWRARR